MIEEPYNPIQETTLAVENDKGLGKLRFEKRSSSGLAAPPLVISPYDDYFTTCFVAGLFAIGRFPLPAGSSAVIIFNSHRDDVQDKIAAWRERGSETLLDLSTMEGVVTETREFGYTGNYKQVRIPVWTGEVPELERYHMFCASHDLWVLMRQQWGQGMFDDLGGLGQKIELSAALAGHILGAMGLGKVDLSDAEKILDATYDEQVLSEYKNLNLPAASEPEWVRSAVSKATDVLALWSFQARRSFVKVAFYTKKNLRGRAPEIIESTGNIIGMDILLDTYASGVPIEDIMA